MKGIEVELGARSYPIYVESGNLDRLGQLAAKHLPGRKVALITDENVGSLYLERARSALITSAFSVTDFILPAGEPTKSLQQADGLYARLIESRFDRSATVIALGGGVVGDLAGFIAATFMRGVPYVQIPTSLLAQTDSSVGGKVGINHRLGKNLIGAFYQPTFVLIDPSVLNTLPERERWAGMAEIVKYGLIADASLFDRVAGNLTELIHLKNPDMLEAVISQCCAIKADVVRQDEKEAGLRKILNFGHTIGHALEALTEYKFYKHGEAVVLGMRAMSWLSREMGVLADAAFQRIEPALQAFPLPQPFPPIDAAAILQKVHLDKKVVQNQINVVLLGDIGRAILKDRLEEKLLLGAVEWLLAEQRRR